MEDHVTRVKNAWSAFTSSCSWVPLGSITFLGGWEQLLTENQGDATWIEQVAAAFTAAGGGSLSHHALDLAASAVSPMSDRDLLEALSSLSAAELSALLTASPGLQAQLKLMDPSAINAWWAGLNPSPTGTDRFSEQQDLLLTTFPLLFGNLEGVPYGARDYANQIALTAAIADLEARIAEAKALVGDTSVANGPVPSALLDMKQSLLDMERQLGALTNINKALSSPAGGSRRYLISLTEDHPPLAAVSIGDLDTATNITYAVPGMGTTTHGMTGWAKAAQNLHGMLPPGSAVVAWIGYETPPTPGVGDPDFGVLDVNRAVAGGNTLATALGGLAAVRGGAVPQLTIVAHSYGTTAAAVALSQPGIRVNNFITLGSAGLPDSVHSAADLNADRVYSGHARDKYPGERESGDQWAWIGRDTSRDHRVNPLSPGFGAQGFGVETGGDAGRVVTDHNPLMGNGDEAGYFDQRTESLQNMVWAIKGETEKITPYAPLGPTNLQEALIEGLSNGY
ncbi:alpha/beta hydrolase family protein [Klugiella xanthotipulae]|uniref:Alpha/beta hydrolase family protein n=2 Tax=Klugiella xanthotipulae TaxID=244735 RepID=A0A543I5P8_9MICO|nr:alpha/beta hydrolase family protein [Klugiella xanthotipulae]